MADRPPALWRKSWRDKDPAATLSGLAAPLETSDFQGGLRVRLPDGKAATSPYLSPTSPLSPRSPPPASPHRAPPPAPSAAPPPPQLKLARGGSLGSPVCVSPASGPAQPGPPRHRRTGSWSLGGSQSSTPSHRRSGSGLLASLGGQRAERAASLRSELHRIVNGPGAAAPAPGPGQGLAPQPNTGSSQPEALGSPGSPRSVAGSERGAGAGPRPGAAARPSLDSVRQGAAAAAAAPLISLDDESLEQALYKTVVAKDGRHVLVKTCSGRGADFEELLSVADAAGAEPRPAPARGLSGDWQRDLLLELEHPDPQGPASPAARPETLCTPRSGAPNVQGFQSPPGYYYSPEGLVPMVQGLVASPRPSPAASPAPSLNPQQPLSPAGSGSLGAPPGGILGGGQPHTRHRRAGSLPTGPPAVYPNPNMPAPASQPAGTARQADPFGQSAAW